MSDNLLTTLTEVSDEQGKQIDQIKDQVTSLQKAVGQMTDWTTAAEKLVESNGLINKLMSTLTVQEMENQFLRRKLQEVTSALSKPQEHRHSHYFPKIAWVTGGLFLALSLAVTGWYNTTSHLSQYRGNDIKYRYMRLVDQATVIQSVRKADSLQQAKPKFFQDSVLAVEQDRKRRLEFWEEADRKEAEASELRKKATE